MYRNAMRELSDASCSLRKNFFFVSHKFALFLCYARVVAAAAAAAARVVVVVAVCLHFVKFVTFAWGAVAVADSACMCCLQHALIVALPIAKARNNSNNSNTRAKRTQLPQLATLGMRTVPYSCHGCGNVA